MLCLAVIFITQILFAGKLTILMLGLYDAEITVISSNNISPGATEDPPPPP